MKRRLFVLLFSLVTTVVLVTTGSGVCRADLLADVQGLSLGMNGYTIGDPLTGDQKKMAARSPLADAYQGTYKFRDGDLVVVADKNTDRVLALYREVADGDRTMLKSMVVTLMDRFGEPTAMAHEKILYWAFTPKGLLSEDEFNQAKKNQQTDRLGIVATAKLNSEIEISPDPVTKPGSEKPDQTRVEKKGKIYFIITSEPLLKQFLNQAAGPGRDH